VKSIKLTAENIYDLYSPKYCRRRLFYRFNNREEIPPGPFEQVIFELGKRHEQDHINFLGRFVDLSSGSLQERASRTIEQLNKGIPIIYQGVLLVDVNLDGSQVQVLGIPDILIPEGSSYVIRDCKLARHATERIHPEIRAQMQVYGYLFEKSFGGKPFRIEAFLGDGSIVDFPYDSRSAIKSLTEILSTVSLPKAPYSPVGWSKCQGCGFRELCWSEAQATNDLAQVYGVDQGLVIALRENGVSTIGQLVDNYTESSLSEITRPWGRLSRRVGRDASRILLQAKAMRDERSIPLERVYLPTSPNLVVFDLEGFPPYLDELEKVYLWGVKVYGENPGPYQPSLSPIERDGDLNGWQDFLSNCQGIFAEYGGIPFIHWASYERTKVKLYRKRYGDPQGIAERVLHNLVDLLPLTKKAMVIAEPSYSLKIVERLAGFKRTQDEYGGDWSMAKYFQAIETDDRSLREDIMAQVLKYNEEDLDATWAVFQWLKGQNESFTFFRQD